MKEQYFLLPIHTNPIFENKALLVQDVNKKNILSQQLYNKQLDKDTLNKLIGQELNDPLVNEESKFSEMLIKNKNDILQNPIFSK